MFVCLFGLVGLFRSVLCSAQLCSARLLCASCVFVLFGFGLGLVCLVSVSVVKFPMKLN